LFDDIHIDKIKLNDKLFTATLSDRTLEFENENIYLAFCKDGLIMTQIKNLESQREEIKNIGKKIDPIALDIRFTSEYLNYLNTIQMILYSSMLKVKNLDYFKNITIRSGEAFTMRFKDGKYISGGVTIDRPNYFLGRYLTQYLSNYPIHLDLRISRRQAIQNNVFQKCFADLKLVIDNPEAIQMLSLVNSALSEYKNLNFRQSLIQSWYVIEYYINKKWIRYLLSKDPKNSTNRITKKRSEFLTGIASSIMSNMLELNSIISLDILRKIDLVRQKRNIAVHNKDLIKKLKDTIKVNPGKKNDKIKDISADDCSNAFLVISDLIKTEYGLEIKISSGYSYTPL